MCQWGIYLIKLIRCKMIWTDSHNHSMYLLWEQGVAGSNPATPTVENKGVRHDLTPFVFYRGTTWVQQLPKRSIYIVSCWHKIPQHIQE